MSLLVYTARLGYKGDDRLDVSLQGNMRLMDAGKPMDRGIGLYFAPSPGLLYPYLTKRKFNRLTPEDWPRYVEAYRAEMRASYRQKQAAWKALLAMDEVTLMCFCSDPAECHRTVLAGILARLDAMYLGERKPAGAEQLPLFVA